MPACALEPANCSISLGSTGMMMPMATMSSAAVTRMKPRAAWRWRRLAKKLMGARLCHELGWREMTAMSSFVPMPGSAMMRRMSDRLFLRLEEDTLHGPEAGLPAGTLRAFDPCEALRPFVGSLLLYRETFAD